MQNTPNIMAFSSIIIYALLIISIAVLLFVAWYVASRGPKRLYRKYKNIDSNALDTDPLYCRNFYSIAIRFRAQQGSKKYTQYIIKHFKFFYEFHNAALRWIDEICTETNQYPVAKGFMLSVIARGHIGKVLTNAEYISGLPENSLCPDEPIILYRHNDTLEFWSHKAEKPVCAMLMGSAKVLATRRDADFIAVSITGIDISGRNRYQVEIKFMYHSSASCKWDDFVAIDRLNELKSWLQQSAKTEIELPDQGIVVVDHSSDEPVQNMHTPLTRKLERLKGNRIQAFLDINNSPAFNDSTPIDVIVLCRHIGIIAITERPEDGDIIYSAGPVWQQTCSGYSKEIDNACINATRAKHTLSNILYHANLKHWPIYNLVVYSSKDVTLTKAAGQQLLQCPVIKLSNIESWLEANTRENDIGFSENDIRRFESVFRASQINEPELLLE